MQESCNNKSRAVQKPDTEVSCHAGLPHAGLPYAELPHAELPHAPRPKAVNEPKPIRLLSRRGFLAVAALTATGALVGPGCARRVETLADVSPCSYDWANLRWEDGRPVYRVNGQMASRWGVDVSEHQEAVDWDAVASDGAGFAFVRLGNRGATEGKLRVDDWFWSHAQGAAAAGITLSVYFFSQSLDEAEAREEAAFVIEQLEEARGRGIVFEYVAYDHEAVEIAGARANDLTDAQFSANAQAFCTMVEQAGYRPMIYGNQGDLLRLSLDDALRWPLWLAEYGVDAPTVDFDFALWQYTNEGYAAGISTPADLNLWFAGADA